MVKLTIFAGDQIDIFGIVCLKACPKIFSKGNMEERLPYTVCEIAVYVKGTSQNLYPALFSACHRVTMQEQNWGTVVASYYCLNDDLHGRIPWYYFFNKVADLKILKAYVSTYKILMMGLYLL